MVNATAANTYRERLQRVLRHIDEHLEGDLSVEALSGVAAFSKHHFHRQFTALFGISVYRYVQLVRLKRAAYKLAFRDGCPVAEIALDAGYHGPEAFARAFRRRLGQTPSDFRRQPGWQTWHAAWRPIRTTRSIHMPQAARDSEVRIVDFPPTRVAALEHRGDPALIGDSIRKFIDWRKRTGLPPKRSATFNILYDDPVTTAPADYRLDLCAATDRDVTPNEAGIVSKIIPGGRCAVLRHVGADDGLHDAIASLYRRWLPQSAEQLRDFPVFLQRVSFFPDVAEHEAVIDIFLPLR